MSKRSTVVDILGNELYAGDVVGYATRFGNRARQSVAVIRKTRAVKAGGRLVPMLDVAPIGVDSGFGSRRSLRQETIGTEHVVLIERGNA